MMILTWTCHVCGNERPDDMIGVLSWDVSADYGFPPGTIRENVRYCVDKVECLNGASGVRFFRTNGHVG